MKKVTAKATMQIKPRTMMKSLRKILIPVKRRIQMRFLMKLQMKRI